MGSGTQQPGNPGRACTPVVALSERQVDNSSFRFAQHLATRFGEESKICAAPLVDCRKVNVPMTVFVDRWWLRLIH
jgi:hypothetical protein